MEVKKLIRDASKIHACLKQLPNDTVVATKRLRIYIPVRFEERELASISSEIYIVGIYAIVNDEGFYGVSKVNAMMRISPTSINTVSVDGDNYYEFTFEPGSELISNINLIKSDTLSYFIFDELIAKGRIPWYISYDDLGGIFETAKKHAGVDVGESHEVIELIASIISRDSNNLYQQYRHVIKDKSTVINNPPTYIPLGSIQYTATNTTAKLAGAYMSDGVVSALVNPSTRSERIESLLTK